MKPLTYFDAFAGFGGFSLGIQQAYVDVSSSKRSEQRRMDVEKGSTVHEQEPLALQQPHCVGFSEIDKYAVQNYSKHFNHKNYGDISKIDWNTVPDFDLLTGGSPCQDFSIAGKRAGIKGERSGLVWEYIRCLEEKKPRYFIWENVKGVMSSRGGFDFANILTAFSEAGYDLQWQVLNAKDFGVPQNRERIFIIGSRGEPRPEVFPIGSSDTVDTQSDGKGNAYCLQAGGDKHRGTYVRTDEQNTLEGGDKPNNPNNIRRTPYTDGMRIRRLTPVECERLMGLPDGWTEGVSDTQRYKLCGNGVVVNVVEEIIKRLTSNHKE